MGYVNRIIHYEKMHKLINLNSNLAIVAIAIVTASGIGFTGCKEAQPREQQVEGKVFNDHFPSAADGFSVTFTSEKKGYSQATVKKADEEMAIIAVSDLIDDSEAASKYQDAAEQISGCPVISRGSQGTAMLVGGRYQISIRSSSDEFSEQDRKEWLSKFDVSAISALK